MHRKIFFLPRVKKCITENLLAVGLKGSKLWKNIDDVYKNKEFRTVTFKQHNKNV